jgi:peptide deformylase
MFKPTLKMGNPLLLKPSEPILPHEFGSQALQDIIQDLQDTRLHYGGLGIAAPQIGVLKQVIIIEYAEDNPRYKGIGSQPLTVIINPKIEYIGDETSAFMEGCLSVPGLKGEVIRPSKIKYEYFDFDGNKITGEDGSFFARVMQHEYDHLQGILYPMQITDFTKFGFIEEFQ